MRSAIKHIAFFAVVIWTIAASWASVAVTAGVIWGSYLIFWGVAQ